LTDQLTAAIYADLAQRVGYAWDSGAARYRNLATGRYVAESTIRGVGERFVTQSVEANIQRITERFLDGKITLSEWQTGMAREIKDGHIVEACLGRGGRAQMTQADWGRVGARLREQYKYLNRFANEIRAGNLSASQILARAKMYAESARTSYFDGLTSAKAMAGFDEEMRVLTPAEHCVGCIENAGFWSPIGSLPPIGSQQCLTNCRCFKQFRKRTTDERGETVEVIG
jgi:hypothetical protein